MAGFRQIWEAFSLKPEKVKAIKYVVVELVVGYVLNILGEYIEWQRDYI